MMRIDAVLALVPGLRSVELHEWIERRWVEPEAAEGGQFLFHDIDVARVRLIFDLCHDMNLAESSVPVVLSLLDQVYELRGTLKAMIRALDTQPASVRSAVLAALERRDDRS